MQASKQQVSKQASKHASKQGSKQATKQRYVSKSKVKKSDEENNK